MKRWTDRLRKDGATTNVYLYLAAICSIYAAVTLGNMSRWSIWFDEAFSAYLMRFSFSEITHFTGLDVHPPVYYWLLKAWTNIFGLSEIALRSMSMMFGIVALIGVFLLVKRLFRSPGMALFATAIVSILPIFVRFGHEARMYTLVLAIVVWASYILVRATEKNASSRWWVGYGAMLVIGMLTHYYVALAWIAHWVWRYFELRAGRIGRFFTKEWIWTHVGAVVLFLWWVPNLINQVKAVQSGFWIPEISAYTYIDYVSNMLLYRQYGEVTGWWAVGLTVVVAMAGVAVWRARHELTRRSASGYWLLVSIAAVPPVILTVLSMPPLASTFMDRYVMYSQVALVIIVALSMAALYQKKNSRKFAQIAAAGLIACMVFGIANVYYFGNYNKNSSTSIRVKEVMQQIDSTSGVNTQPVIAASPWIYFEASFYETESNPVYFLDSTAEGYRFGSLAMLRDSEEGKIRDVQEFANQHRYVWFLDNSVAGDVKPPVAAWQRIVNVEAYDPIDDNTKYRASLFDTRPSGE